MNVSGMIDKMKLKMRERETAKAERIAKGLKDLKEKRIRAEGQRKIYDLQTQERARLNQANKDIRRKRFESSILGNVALNIQKNIKEKKKKDAPSLMLSGKDHPMFRK